MNKIARFIFYYSNRIGLLVFPIMSLLFGLLYYSEYYKWRNQFNENGRYFDLLGNVVYLEQNSILIIPFIFFIVLSVVNLWMYTKSKK
jgi:hypothetical protein